VLLAVLHASPLGAATTMSVRGGRLKKFFAGNRQAQMDETTMPAAVSPRLRTETKSWLTARRGSPTLSPEAAKHAICSSSLRLGGIRAVLSLRLDLLIKVARA